MIRQNKFIYFKCCTEVKFQFFFIKVYGVRLYFYNQSSENFKIPYKFYIDYQSFRNLFLEYYLSLDLILVGK